KHIMVTIALLNNLAGLQKPNNLYTLVLYLENINSTNKKLTKSIETIKMNYSQMDGHLKEP
ncbi:33239_t:CDS:2, partial [Gigaspora margarita]